MTSSVDQVKLVHQKPLEKFLERPCPDQAERKPRCKAVTSFPNPAVIIARRFEKLREGYRSFTILLWHHVTSTQRSMMIQIERSGKPSMGELAEALVIDKSALAHNPKPLERDGLIVIAVDSDDRRSKRVALTKRGAARLKESKVLWDRAQQRFEAAFGAKRAAELRQILAVIASLEFEAAFDGVTAF